MHTKPVKDALVKSYKDNALAAQSLVPRYKKGDTVRILKGLTENVEAVKDFLGRHCKVLEIRRQIGVSSYGIEYLLRLPGTNRQDFFKESELDQRIKSQSS